MTKKTKAAAAETQSSQLENPSAAQEQPGEQFAEPAPAQPDNPAAAPEQPEQQTPAAPAAPAEPLLSLDELAHRHRVPGWQQAALLRLAGWADGKKVSAAEYKAALEQLNNRRQGGGRR